MGISLHSHGHGHSHASNAEPHSHQDNINVQAAFIHVIGDFIQSIGIFIAALIIYFRPDLGIVDPICTFLFSVLVLITTINILRDALRVLMEGKPKGIDFNDVKQAFLSIDEVKKVHNLRLWSLSTGKDAVSAHIVINPGINTQTILQQANQVAHNKYMFFDVTLQIEEFSEAMHECRECQGPE